MRTVGRRLRQLKRWSRPYRSTMLLVVAVVLLSLAWVGVRAALAGRDLVALERDLSALQAASGDPRRTDLDQLLGQAQDHAARADGLTHDVVWKVWSHAPFLRDPLRLVAGVSRQARVLTDGALPPVVRAATTVRQVRRPDGSFDVRSFGAQAVALQRAAMVASGAYTQVDRLPTTRFHALNSARDKLVHRLDQFATRTQGLASASAAAPDLLGFEGRRRYLIAVQNNAESRASGGIVGAYGILRFDRGKAVLERFGSDAELPPVQDNAIDFGPEWRSRYDLLGQARDWREVTSSPDFPTVGATLRALWKATHGGDSLDGVLSVDAPALADVLQATGPVTSRRGSRLTSADFVSFTLSDAYRLFPDKAARTAVLSDNAKAVFDAVVAGAGSPLVLGERLGHAVNGGHLKLWSAHRLAQADIARTTVAGALPVRARPLLSVITQDAYADKLSYYLRRDISYATLSAPRLQDFGSGAGPEPQAVGRLRVVLSNTAPSSGLPDYVAPATDLATGATIPRGRMRVSVSVYLARNGVIDDPRLDGRSVRIASQTDKGLSVYSFVVEIDPGRQATLDLTLKQPAAPGQPLRFLPQPLAFDDRTTFTGTRVVSTGRPS